MYELYDVEAQFPFLFGGAFIEAYSHVRPSRLDRDFPSFSEGLSLRLVGGGKK